ncbi:MAG: hypothetical protein ABIV48_08930, partial [Pyrinomonadaceae bacterium]
MKKTTGLKFVFILAAISITALTLAAQKPKQETKAAKSAIFAVLNDGQTLEPIAYISKGKLEPAVNGSDDAKLINAFNRSYYKTGSAYRLIFGGANSGA